MVNIHYSFLFCVVCEAQHKLLFYQLSRILNLKTDPLVSVTIGLIIGIKMTLMITVKLIK